MLAPNLTEIKSHNRFRTIFILTLITPVVILLVSTFFVDSSPNLPLSPQNLQNQNTNLIKPSDILNNLSAYANKELTVTGKVVAEPVVCERKECPPDDACCGCANTRSLLLVNSDSSLSNDTSFRLQLRPPNQASVCQRIVGKCDYNCQDWEVNQIYNVSGKLHVEPAPPGWKRSLDFYFEVAQKEVTISPIQSPTSSGLIEGLKQLLNRLKTSGSYVIP